MNYFVCVELHTRWILCACCQMSHTATTPKEKVRTNLRAQQIARSRLISHQSRTVKDVWLAYRHSLARMPVPVSPSATPQTPRCAHISSSLLTVALGDEGNAVAAAPSLFGYTPARGVTGQLTTARSYHGLVLRAYGNTGSPRAPASPQSVGCVVVTTHVRDPGRFGSRIAHIRPPGPHFAVPEKATTP